MSEPDWSLPMNRSELIARVEALEAALRKCCRVLKDGSMGDAQAVYHEAAALSGARTADAKGEGK